MANKQMGLLGRKVGMTQFFEDDGDVVAVTVIEAGPCTVLQVKTEDSKTDTTRFKSVSVSVKPPRTTSHSQGM